MKNSGTIGGSSSKKSNVRTKSGSNGTFKPNRTKTNRPNQTKTSKPMSSSKSSNKTKSSNQMIKKSPKKGSKKSPELRPRRRASQTYFFKYQLAKNPLKVEEDELKLALIASLQQCNQNSSPSSTKKAKSSSKKNSVHLSNGSSINKETEKHKNKSKLNEFHLNNLPTTANPNNTSALNNYFIPYSPYTPPIQKTEPLDEDYLKKYKPETEDFLTFICFRTTAPNYQSNKLTINGIEETTLCNTNTGNNQIPDKLASIDSPNLKQCTSSFSKLANINSPTITDSHSPNNHRRPTRQSPRLASSNRKISENDSSNHTVGTSTTAYDTSITYEEDMKRASIALEDMAQEINSSDDIHNEVAQNMPDCISKSSSSFKNNKHLVKGLMTREFAGGFADEDTIFESISNHKI